MAVEKVITEWGLSDIVSVGALGVAFLALFIAPIVNARISRRQVIAPMRQAWINSLRDKLAEILSIVSVARFDIVSSIDASTETRDRSLNEDRLRYERLVFLVASIELHINSRESDHQSLVALLKEISQGYHDNNDVEPRVAELVELSQKILSDEWKATKKT
ncbi:hypothetical protein [Vibrio parahaemolyticus]|uniref:hypothetical protein n=1 Tax=Vibrio parahaemolyticus TaxID=670 RepID=UPI001E473D70|nr:hypothetical protein [Vibrio parahaemolyticus]